MIKKVCTLLVALAMVSGLSAGAFAEGTAAPEVQGTTTVVETLVVEQPVVEEVPVVEETAPVVEPVVETPAPVVEAPVVEQPAAAIETIQEDIPAPVQYTILYRYLDGEEEKEVIQMFWDNEVIREPDFEPSADGCIFKFWYDVEAEVDPVLGVQPYAFNEMAPTKNMIFKPYFETIQVADQEEVIAEEPETVEEEETVEESVAQETVTSDESTLPGFITIIENPVDTLEGEGLVVLDEEANETEDASSEGLVLLDDEDDEAEEEEMFTMEDTDVPLAGPALDQCSIDLSSNHGDCIGEGDTITVVAKLNGYDPYNVDVQWQFNDGSGWVDAEGANALEHSFEATRETVNYDWRIIVNVLGTI